MRRFALFVLLIFLFALPACAEDEVIVFDDEFDAFYQSLLGQETPLGQEDPLGQETDVWEEEIPDTQAISEEDAAGAYSAQPTDQDAQEAFVYSRTLKYGMEGEDVRQMQERLAQLGYFNATATGGYYQKTREAVRAFQKQNALEVDGVAGKATLTTLFDAALAVDANATPRPTATPAPPQYKLLVDVTNQITRAYALDAQGEYTVLVREMICSTGTKSNPTPIKSCTLPGKRARWGYFPEWGSHAQYLTRIDSSNAFHSVLYNSPNEMDLVVSSFKKLGERASHGCVRLLVEDAKWIYENCPAGTPVTIYEGESDPEYTMSLKPAELDTGTMLPKPSPQPTPEPSYDAKNPPVYTRLLKKGVQGTDVYYVQRRLAELGYYHGTVTGGYYEGTIAAVKAFQKENGLETDGVTGAKTYAALFLPRPIDEQDNSEDGEEEMEETPLPEGFADNYQPMTPVPEELRMTPIPTPESTPAPTRAPPEETPVPLEEINPEWLEGAVG